MLEAGWYRVIGAAYESGLFVLLVSSLVISSELEGCSWRAVRSLRIKLEA